jgi:hypothetical protein
MIKFGTGNLRIPRFEKPVYVVAGGMTDFRKRYPEKNTCQLCTEALRMAVEENDLKVSPEDVRRRVNWVVYSQFADHFGDQLLAAAKVHDYLGFDPLGNIEVKTGGATGGSSVLAAAQAVASGYADCVPVVGWERMDEVTTKVGNSYIASAACKDFESELGWMYAAYYALMAQRYQYENNVPRETLAQSVDYRLVDREFESLGIDKKCARIFSRTDEQLRPAYELIRQGKMPQAETMLGRLLNALLGTGEKGVLREQKIRGEKLPAYGVVRRSLGPAGAAATSEDDGWFVKGVLLGKGGR